MKFVAIRISTRLVLLIGKWAIKIPLGVRGWWQGQNEAKIWSKYTNHWMLAPLLFSFGGIVIQKRMQPLTQFDPEKVRLIRHSINELNIANCDLMKQENWGMDGERQVLLDYGISSKVASMYPFKWTLK
jgi:hypothetical protein